jgi:ABC-type sugar transport system permease subunit
MTRTRAGQRRIRWVLVVPAVAFVLAFHFIPIGFGGYYAFTDRNLLGHAHWIGLRNFRDILHDPNARAGLWNTLEILDYNGTLNRILDEVGLGSLKHGWTGEPQTALWSILAVMVWQYTGLAMVLYLAGLQGVSDDVREAALVDGAPLWLRFRKVTASCSSRARRRISTTGPQTCSWRHSWARRR